MPITKLPIPDKPRTLAFRGFVKLLKNDPQLKRVVKTWQAWEGERNEDAMPETMGNIPLVRLTPLKEPAQRLAELGAGFTVLDTPIRVKVETATAGSNWDDSSNLWGLFEDCLFSQNPAARAANDAALAALGIRDVEELEPGIGTFDGNLTTAVGFFKLIFALKT